MLPAWAPILSCPPIECPTEDHPPAPTLSLSSPEIIVDVTHQIQLLPLNAKSASMIAWGAGSGASCLGSNPFQVIAPLQNPFPPILRVSTSKLIMFLMNQVPLLTTNEKWASTIVGCTSCGVSHVGATLSCPPPSDSLKIPLLHPP